MPRVYDQWAGNPKGIPEDPTRCVYAVPDSTGWHDYQCSRKRGYGPNGEYCKQHAKIIQRRESSREYDKMTESKLDTTLAKLEAVHVRSLLKKGLKATWREDSIVGWLDVMASLHAQTKDWEWPSDSSYQTLSPRSLTTLVLCLEERRESQASAPSKEVKE